MQIELIGCLAQLAKPRVPLPNSTFSFVTVVQGTLWGSTSLMMFSEPITTIFRDLKQSRHELDTQLKAKETT